VDDIIREFRQRVATRLMEVVDREMMGLGRSGTAVETPCRVVRSKPL